MTTEQPILVWFRDDLRIADHPALAAAPASGRGGKRPAGQSVATR
jgi:deoxyribodipyrimidine photolyase